MQPIGTLIKTGDLFNGTVRTLALNVNIRLVPVEGASEQGPDYRIYAGAAEIGAGWKKTSESKRDYISLKLDDPSLPNPIYASLFPADEPDTHTLLWSRPKAN
jgi:uncharacterized protein (DUF736 family)